MDYNTKLKSDVLRRALYPLELQSDFPQIESYVYIIQKKFRPYAESKEELNLFKIGESRTGSDFTKRLGDLQTALISFKVHRIYLYEVNQQATKGKTDKSETQASKAERTLHMFVKDDFGKNGTVRLKFRSGNESEWFVIPEKEQKKFLEFCDKKIFYDIQPSTIYGTRFDSKTGHKIIMKGHNPKIVGIKIVEGKAVKKDVVRQTESRDARSIRQAKSALVLEKKIKNIEAKLKQEKKEGKKTLPFWKDVFLNKNLKPFTDKDLSTKYKLHFDEVEYFNKKDMKENNISARPQPFVFYSPKERIKTTRKKKNIDPEDELENSGYLTVNEALLMYPALKTKHKKSYDFYVNLNNYDEDLMERYGKEII